MLRRLQWRMPYVRYGQAGASARGHVYLVEEDVPAPSRIRELA
jgi:hypothetical protein